MMAREEEHCVLVQILMEQREALAIGRFAHPPKIQVQLQNVAVEE